jgi:hypothetical protein
MSFATCLSSARKAIVPPEPFARGCLIVVALWLFGVFLPLNLAWNDHTRSGASRKFTLSFPNADFSQYYIAGVAARYDLWAHLYPQYKPEWAGQPGRQIWSSTCAEADPEMLEHLGDLPAWRVENIAPPPQAILCLPLGFFPFATAFKIWMTGLMGATLGVVICAAQIYRRLGGQSGRFEGGLYLAGAVLPLLPRIGAGDNVMMYLIFCVGVAALTWTGQQPFKLGFSLIIPAVFKGLTATWCPLLLFKPVKWRVLGWMVFWTALLNGLVLWFGGWQPYATWLRDILPDATSMETQRYWEHCMNLKGIAFGWGWESFPAGVIKVFYAAGLVTVYLGYWRRCQAPGPAAFANVCAAMVALLMLFNLCNKVSWLPYVAFLLPFAGWVLLEYAGCSPAGKFRVKLAAASLFVVVPAAHFLVSKLLLKQPHAGVEAGRDLYAGVEVISLALAYRRLFFAPRTPLKPA